MTETRILPASTESEKFVLGAALLDSANFGTVSGLTADDFALEKHRRIFAAMSAISERNQIVDRVTLAEEIRSRGQLESVDGFTYLTSLDDGLPQIYNLESYVRIVREQAILRRAVVAADKLATELCQPGAGMAAIEQAQALLATLAATRTESPLRNSEEIVERYGGFDKLLAPPTGVSVPSCWPRLAEMIPVLQAGELWILAGITGLGKTTAGVIWGLNAAQQGVGTANYSMEMPDGAILKRTLCSLSGVSFGRIWKGGAALESHHRRELQIARAALAELPWWVADDATPTVADIRQQLRKAKQGGRNVGLVIVDYLQLVTSKGVNSNERAAAISRGLKLLAMDLKVPLIALSQFSRPPKAEKEWIPTRSYLRDSGSIENDADGIIFVHALADAMAEAKRNKTAINGMMILEKQRNGPTGTIPVTIDGKYMRISEVA